MRAWKWTVPLVALALAWAAPVPAEEGKAAVTQPESAEARKPVRIGYVDLQRALMTSKAGKKAKADFKARVDKLEKRLQGKKETLEKMKEDLERRAVVMREEERRKLADEFERKRLDLKLDFEDSQAELQKKDQELTGTIVTSLQQVIKEIGDNNGYTLILELGSSPVLYFKSADDITDEVLKSFDARS